MQEGTECRLTVRPDKDFVGRVLGKGGGFRYGQGFCQSGVWNLGVCRGECVMGTVDGDMTARWEMKCVCVVGCCVRRDLRTADVEYSLCATCFVVLNRLVFRD